MTRLKFASRVQKISVSAIKQMPLLARAVPDAVSLGQGIPSLSTPAYIRRKVIELLEGDGSVGKYSLQPGLPQLKAAVAETISLKCRRAVDAETETFITAGAMEALFTALVSLIEEGDEVLVFDPSYASHIEQILFAGGIPVFVPLQEEDGWQLSETALEKSVTGKTKAIIVCNPGNPTGKVFSEGELDAIVRIAARSGIAVIADETYDFLVYGQAPFRSLTSYSEIREQVVACYSFSKQFAMTGWRVGYMFAPPGVIEQALKVHDAAVICAPTISQYAAFAALTGQPDPGEESVKAVLARRRNLICERLDELSDLFSYVRPEGAYYVLARYLKTDCDSKEFAMRLLHEAKVIAIPGAAFGPRGEQHVRFSFGGTEADINEAFTRIEKWNQRLS